MDAIDDFRAVLAQAAITPDKPLYAVLLALHNAGLALDAKTEWLSELPDEIERRQAPVLAQMQVYAERVEKVANRPLLTSNQVRYDLAPVLLAAINAATAITGVVLLLIAGGIGMGIHWWQTPRLVCEDARGGVVCYHWLHPPTQAAPPPEPAPASPSAAPASSTAAKRGRT